MEYSLPAFDAPLWWVIGGMGSIVVYWLLRRALGRDERRLRRRRAERASLAEEDAGRMLEGRGYRVVGREVDCEWEIRVGDDLRRFDLYADYLVERRGRRFVAEVKSGAQAPRIDHAATRRQLLEYSRAFDVDGVLLVDVENGRVDPVDFGG